ncbi:MAG: VWA domain-containing protein [Coriobacteriia bacterium]
MKMRLLKSGMALAIACVLIILAAPATGAEPGLVVAHYGGATYPTVRLLVTLPADLLGGASDPKYSLLENGHEIPVVAVEPLAGEREPVDVALVVDTSGSMKGKALADAQSAALAFVEEMAADDHVALFSFASVPNQAAAFTTDKAEVGRAIKALAASGETAAYDALVRTAQAFKDSASRRAIVLLSDGGDTVSGSSLDDAVRAVKEAGTPVYVVALTTSESNPNALRAVSEGSGGRFLPVVESGRLADLYQGIARELTSQYVVSYESAEPLTTDLEVALTATAGGKSASGSIVIPNPSFSTSGDGAAPLTPGKASPALFVLAVVTAFGTVAFASGGLLSVLAERRKPLARVARYDQVGTRKAAGTAANATDTRAKILETVDLVAGKRGLTKVMSEKLERAGLPLRVSEYMYFHFLAVLASGVVVRLFTGSLAGAVVVVIIMVALPLMILEYMIDRRRRAFEDQLPEILNLLAGSLRAGWGLLQAIGVVVEQMPAPASIEFKRVETEARLGLSVEDALEKMVERLGSEDFRWTVTAINIQREVGGNLAEILDIVAATMRDRAELRRHIASLTAEGRLSGSILLALPFLELAALLVVNPAYLAIMLTNPFGWFLIVAGVVLMIVGAIWLRAAMRVEV